MILTPVFPSASDPLDLEQPDAREHIAALYALPGPDWLRVNLIGSVSGSAAGVDGTSESLSNAVDRIILRTIRSLADVVVVGAASVRAEGYFVPRQGTLAIVSRSGDFTGHQIKGTTNSGSVVVLCPAGALEKAHSTIGMQAVTVIPVPDVGGTLSAAAILQTLRDLGFRSIVAEGGPTLATHLLVGGVVDELCLTTSPVLNGGSLPLFGTDRFDARELTLSQLLLDDNGATYARWRVLN